MILKLTTYHPLLLVDSPSIDIDFLWKLTSVFMGLGLLYFVSIFLIKSRLHKQAFKRASKRSELAPIISKFLFHSSENPEDEQKEYINLKIEIRAYLKDKSFRKILTEILIDLQKDVSGTTEERLFKLYKELDLHHEAFKRLGSWRWEIVSKGILELTQMQVIESYQLITKFINDKRPTIRKQAEIATIKLRKEGINYILDSTQYPISEWQQLKMIEALSTLKDYEPPRFKSWLISENKDVVLFALRLIKHYNQNEAAPSIIELVKHSNSKIKLAAIACIRDFNYVEAKRILQAMFLHCNDEVKTAILGTLAIFGDKADIPFFNGIVDTEPNFLVSTKARSAINAIIPDSILPEKNILEVKDQYIDEDTVSLEKRPNSNGPKERIKDTILNENPKGEVKDQLEANNEGIGALNFNFEVNQGQIESSLKEELDYSPSKLTAKKQPVANAQIGSKDGTRSNLKEIQFLERVMEDGVVSEVRFNAFKKLKQLQNNFYENRPPQKQQTIGPDQTTNTAKENIDAKTPSIFAPLYEKADSMDSKLLLIEQMGLVGCKKEWRLLKKLLNGAGKSMNAAIKGAIEQIEIKQDCHTKEAGFPAEAIAVLPQDLMTNKKKDRIGNTGSYPNSKKIKENVVKQDDNELLTDNRLPLELCFLYNEFGIKSAKQEEKVFDFGIAKEFFDSVKKDEPYDQ